MKIGITCYSTYGGSGVLATELGKLLAVRGHEVHFITRDLPYRLQNTFHQNLLFHPVDMLEYPLFGDSAYPLALAAKMAEVVRREKLDLLHVHYAIPHATSAILARQMLAPIKIPIITTLHGTDITLVGKNSSFTEVTEFSINQSDAISVVSEFLKKDTHAFFAIKKELEVIPNFVDADLFVPAGEKFPCTQFLGENHGTVFVHISNFRPVKRTLDVIHAFQKIHSEEEDVTLLMVGDGPDLAACRNLVEKYGISPKVRFLGKQNDVISILQLADILLFPSEHESFGLVALEAMSCEKPVIASQAGGLPEVVEHGVSGYLCEVGNTQEMADYGLRLVRDCALKLSMGKKARQVVLKNFTPEKIIPLYENLYQKALSSIKN